MKKNGFTLIELMTTVVIIAIISAIAYPSYTYFTEKKDLAVAKQTALQLAAELEKFKNKNFSYKGFNADYLYENLDDEYDDDDHYYDNSKSEMYLPVGATANTALFRLSIKDLSSKLAIASPNIAVTGQNWAIVIERMPLTGSLKQPKNYDLLLTSTGIKCATRTANIVKELTDCGDNHADW